MPDTRPAAELHRADRLDRAERAELEWLRAENKLLRTERDILAQVAADLAEDTEARLLRVWMHRGRQ